MTRSLTFLDQSGDTTIVWDEETDEKMLAIIERKMKEGFTFFILKPSVIPFRRARPAKAKTIGEVRKAGAVILRDEDLDKLFLNGDITTQRADTGDIQTVRRAANANDVVTNHSVGMRVARGG